MEGFVRRIAKAGAAALLSVFLLMPVAASAATASSDNTNTTVSDHIARALAKAPRGITHWTVDIRGMTLMASSGQVGKRGAAILNNTVYGSCGSSWMAIGNQGAGHAWIAFGWDIYYSAYSESWSTAVGPRGSSSGAGAVAPWSSTSWDNGYSAWEGPWVYTWGWAYMAAYLYWWEPYSACANYNNPPFSSTVVTP